MMMLRRFDDAAADDCYTTLLRVVRHGASERYAMVARDIMLHD